MMRFTPGEADIIRLLGDVPETFRSKVVKLGLVLISKCLTLWLSWVWFVIVTLSSTWRTMTDAAYPLWFFSRPTTKKPSSEPPWHLDQYHLTVHVSYSQLCVCIFMCIYIYIYIFIYYYYHIIILKNYYILYIIIIIVLLLLILSLLCVFVLSPSVIVMRICFISIGLGDSPPPGGAPLDRPQ